MQTLLSRSLAYLTPNSSSPNLPQKSGTFSKAPTPTLLFPPVNAAVDGEECLHDCTTCTLQYPRKFEIEEKDELYGHVKAWSTHLIVATGKSDWVRDVADEKGSVMEAVGRYGMELQNGRVMLSASNIPTPHGGIHGDEEGEARTTVLLMPAWKVVDDITPDDVGGLLEGVMGVSVTNTTPLKAGYEKEGSGLQTPEPSNGTQDEAGLEMSGHTRKISIPRNRFSMRSCPHKAVVLMCSQKTRDARCGQSAPLLRREFERHLRPLGLYRDLHDERPGGVGVYFISHVGGHKYSANIIIYRRRGKEEDGEGDGDDGAVQGIWLARVRPDEVENIVRYTVLQGKVVKPERQLRGGFDRERGVVSW